jgi:hypothetical protein
VGEGGSGMRLSVVIAPVTDGDGMRLTVTREGDDGLRDRVERTAGGASAESVFWMLVDKIPALVADVTAMASEREGDRA